MKPFKFFLAFVLGIASCSAKKDIYEEVTLFQKNSREWSDAKKIEKAKELKEKFSKSLLGYVNYLKHADSLGLADLEIKKIKDSKLREYFKIRSQTFSLGYLPADKNKQKKVIKELEDFLEKNPRLQADGWFDILNMTYDRRIRERVAKKLFELNKKSPHFIKKYVSSLDPLKESFKVLDFCKKELKKKRPDLDYCNNLKGIREHDNKEQVKAYKNIISQIAQAALQTSDLKLKKEAWNILYRLDEDDAFQKLAASIIKEDKNWVPIEIYRDYFGVNNYQDFILLSHLFDLSREPDFNQKVTRVLAIAQATENSQIVRGEAFYRLSYFYQNPANEDIDLAFKYAKKAYELRPEKSSYAMNLIRLGLKKGASHELLWKAVGDAERSFENKKRKSLESPENFLMIPETSFRAELNYFKGRLFLKEKNNLKAHNFFQRSYSFEKGPEAAFYLGQMTKKANPYASFKWFLKAKMSDENKLTKAQNEEIEKNILDFSRNNYSADLGFGEVLAAFKAKEKGDKVGGEGQEDAEKHPLIGKPFLKSDLKDIKGKTYDWTKLKGKKVVLSFWATWCTPCFSEMAVLNKMVKEKKIKNLKVIGICTDGIANKRKVAKIMEKSNIQYDIILDDGSYRDQYDIAAIPANFFIGEDGKIISNETGYSPQLEEVIAKQFSL